MAFADTLKYHGWIDSGDSVEFRKGSWRLVFDTSSWMEVSTANNPRVFDVPMPTERLESWTLNLVEHLCVSDDQIFDSNTCPPVDKH